MRAHTYTKKKKSAQTQTEVSRQAQCRKESNSWNGSQVNNIIISLHKKQ